MFKRVFAGACFAAALTPAFAQSTGDLMFTAFNADEDGFVMVALVDLAPNTKVFFSDNEWDGSTFNTGESYSSWTTGAAIVNAGTVIRFSSVDSATLLAASVGTFVRETVASSANWGLSQGNDTVYAFLGTTATTPTTFLAAISNGALGTATDGVLTNTGLAIGSGAVQLTASSDFAEYTGARTGQTSFAGYKALVGDVTHWNVLGDGAFATNAPNTTAFSVSPIPEPGSWALMVAGLAAVGFVARRR